MKKILEIKNLTKYYGKTLAVKDLSLELQEGEIFGFIGPNGAGKSTTIRSIMNLINKTKGEVYFLGETLSKDNINLKEQIGYLPSEVYLYEELTVKEMLDYHESFYKKDLSKRRKELVKKLKLDEKKKIEEKKTNPYNKEDEASVKKTVIKASSEEELIEKIKNINWDTVLGETVGAKFDFSI